MSFRSAAERRTADTDLLVPSKCPALAEGESVRYWTKLPHGARARVDSAANTITFDPTTGAQTIRYDAVARGRQTLIEGIVEMTLLDERGRTVHWDERRAEELLDGMPPGLLAMLGVLIDSEAPPRLTEKVDPQGDPLPADADPETAEGADTEGNA